MIRAPRYTILASLFLLPLVLLSCSSDKSSPTGNTGNNGNTANVVHVSWNTGDDGTGDGSQAAPFKTLTKAYQTSGVQLIKLEAASHDEVPLFKAGVQVEGGYAVPSWIRGTGYTIFFIGNNRATADSIATT